MFRLIFMAIAILLLFICSYKLLMHLKLSYIDRQSFEKANPALTYKSNNQLFALIAMALLFPLTLYAYFYFGTATTIVAFIGFIAASFIYKKC